MGTFLGGSDHQNLLEIPNFPNLRARKRLIVIFKLLSHCCLVPWGHTSLAPWAWPAGALMGEQHPPTHPPSCQPPGASYSSWQTVGAGAASGSGLSAWGVELPQ